MDASDASMDEVDARARSHFRVARALYDEGRVLQAAEEFKKAYELSGRTELLFNMYLGYRDGGAFDEAAESLRAYLDAVGEVEGRAALEAKLEAMERNLERREQQAEPQPPAREPAPAREAAPPPPPETKPHWIGWAVAGTGAAMVLASVATGAAALGKANDLDDACPDQRCPAGFPLESRRDEARRYVRATDALLFGGLTLAASGVALLFRLQTVEDRAGEGPNGEGGSDPAASPREPKAGVRWAGAGCGPNGCGLSLGGSF